MEVGGRSQGQNLGWVPAQWSEPGLNSDPVDELGLACNPMVGCRAGPVIGIWAGFQPSGWNLSWVPGQGCEPGLGSTPAAAAWAQWSDPEPELGLGSSPAVRTWAGTWARFRPSRRYLG